MTPERNGEDMQGIGDSTVLIVDDQEFNISLLRRILTRVGFERVFDTRDPLRLPALLQELEPDVVLLDMHMPDMDGLQALQLIRDITRDGIYLPVLMLTADNTPEMKRRGLEAGVDDFLTKPYDRSEVGLRVRNLLRTRLLHKQLHRHNSTLEERVRERTDELRRAKQEIIELLGRAAEYRDDMTGQHTYRVGELAGIIAQRLGMEPEEAELIRRAAPLHDIGKIGIPDELLLKPGRFEPQEFERMKAHTIIGADILAGSSFPVLRTAKIIALHHHEKWDGTGYPQGLQGEEIPVEARVVAIADFYDALMHERPYKKAWTVEETLEEIRSQRGLHFDPRIVDAFIGWIEESGTAKG